MIENSIIGFVFFAAVAYLISNVKKQFSSETSGGCASCPRNCQAGKIETLPIIKK